MKMLQRKITARFGRLQEVAARLRSYLESVSRQSSETEVSAFVTQIAGTNIDERVQDLTPVSQNYLVSMGKGSGTGSHGSQAVRAAAPAKKSGALIGALVGAALLGLVGGGAAILRPWEHKAAGPETALVADPVGPKPTPADPTPDPRPKPDKPAPTPDPEPQTVLVLGSEPAGAKVYNGERLLGLTPLRVSTLSPETDYQLVLEKPGYEPGIVPLRLEKGATKELSVPLAKKVVRADPGPPRASGSPARRAPVRRTPPRTRTAT
jgi:hypothetical protein